NAVTIAVIDRDLLMMRRNVLAFTMTGDEATAKRVRDGAADAKKDLAALIDNTANPERKAKLSQALPTIDAYANSFEKAVQLRAHRDSTTKERIVLGGKTEENLNKIIQGTLADREFETAVLASNVQGTMMSARLNANRFNATPDQKIADQVRKDLESVIKSS